MTHECNDNYYRTAAGRGPTCAAKAVQDVLKVPTTLTESLRELLRSIRGAEARSGFNGPGVDDDVHYWTGKAEEALARSACTESELRLEIARLRRDCAEAYQIMGAVLLAPGDVVWTDDDATRTLDNLSAAVNGNPRPHDDLLPWPK